MDLLREMLNLLLHKEDHRFEVLIHKLEQVHKQLDVLIKQGERIMATQAEVAADLVKVKDQLVKIGTETTSLLTKIEELTAIIAEGPVSAELQTALDAVKAQAQVVDDLVPDAP